MSSYDLPSGQAPRSLANGYSRRRFLKTAALAAAVSSSVAADAAADADESSEEHERPFWGDLHTHTALSDGNGQPEDHFQIAKSHLDFWAMTDHAYDDQVFSLDYRQHGSGRRLLNEAWAEIQELCRAHEQPGQFVPFLGYEWTNFGYGHHNVYYLQYNEPIRMPPTLPQLYASLENVDALVIPHHPAYPVGVCGKDWGYHDASFSPFVEIYSLHGSSETPEGVCPLLTPGSWMGPGGPEGCVQAGLSRGHKLGIIASSDSHGDHPGAYDLGLVAAYADQLTRESLWDAFHSRRVYAVTGDRIHLDFGINGHPMGSTIGGPGKRMLRIWALAWDKVDRVEVIKNNSLYHTFAEPAGNTQAGRRTRFRFFVQWGWDVRSDHPWQGSLSVADGRILQALPCYRGHVAGRKETGITSLTGTTCQWTSKTEQAKYLGLASRFADAMAFEVECPDHGRLQFSLACNGMKQDVTLSVADILNKSMVQYIEHIPATNDGAYWHRMQSCAKFKVHQGWPTDQLSLNLTCEDDGPMAGHSGTDFYYVRLIQRNGQRAWSSPIWVENG